LPSAGIGPHINLESESRAAPSYFVGFAVLVALFSHSPGERTAKPRKLQLEQAHVHVCK